MSTGPPGGGGPLAYTPQELFEQAPCGYVTTSPTGAVLVVNDTLLEWLGTSREDVLGGPLTSLLSPAGQLTWESQVVPLLHLQGWARAVEVELRGPSGTRPRVLVSARVLRADDGTPVGVRIVAFDAAERSEYERALLRARREAEQSETRLRALHRVVADLADAPSPRAVADSLREALAAVFGGTVAVWRTEGDGPLVQVSGGSSCELLPGVAGPDSLPGQAVAAGDVLVVDPGTAAERPDLLRQLRAARLHVVVVAPLLSGDEVLGAYAVGFGRVRAVPPDELDLHRTLGRQAGQALRRAQLNDELGHLALHDPLTGLPNRLLFSDRAEQALARSRRAGTSVTVMLLDLDGFKAVNDGHGHRAGDAVLVETARRLAAAVRPSDTVARMGGDEFTVLAEGLDEAHAREVAARLELAVRTPFELDGGRVRMSASVGLVVHAPADGDQPDASQLVRAADAAMYDAKRGGRGRHRVYDAALRAASAERTGTLRVLEQALSGDGVVLHYQPVYDLRGGAVVGAEALCRLRAPGGGLVMPDRFIPAAEESGLVLPLGRRVLELAARQTAAWCDAGRCLDVAVNIAAAQAAEPSFPELLAEVLAAAGCPPRCLSLELTESALLTATPDTVATLTAVRELGVGLALDDFGTRYASLHYVQEFPLDTLKIDRSFVAGVPDADVETAIVRAVASLASELGMSCVAEGIEREEQRAFLAELGVLGQGYLLARPAPAEDVTALLLQEPLGLPDRC